MDEQRGETIEHRERQLAEAQRVARIGSFEWDVAANRVTWSDELYRIYGQEPQSFGATFEAFLAQVHPDDRDTVAATIGDAVARGGEFRMRERVIRPDGTVRHLSSWGEVVRGPDGNPARLVGICQDVTEQREREEALRASRADLVKFRALVDTSSDFIAIAGLDGTVVYVNPAGRRLVGLAEDADVTATTIADYLTDEGLRASVEVEQPAVVANGRWSGRSTLRDMRGGPPIPVEISSFLMFDPETAQPLALATVQRDIRDEIAARDKVAELDRQRWELLRHLVEAQEAERDRIAAGVHDDTVQVMAAVHLRLGLLRQELAEAGSPQAELAERLRESVATATDRLRALLFDLETPARHGTLANALRECAARVLADTAVRWQVDVEPGLDLPDAPRVVAYRICHEAVVNASKHARPSEIVVRAGRSAGGVEVSVTDDGVGLDPSVEGSPPGHYGLTSMRERAAVAGGWWRVDRAEPQGTVVRFWLPDGSGLDASGEQP